MCLPPGAFFPANRAKKIISGSCLLVKGRLALLNLLMWVRKQSNQAVSFSYINTKSVNEKHFCRDFDVFICVLEHNCCKIIKKTFEISALAYL